MSSTSLLIIKMIDNLEFRPGMFLSESSFLALGSYITGYFSAMQDVSSIPYNNNFSEWINRKGKRTALFWADYIYIVLANKDDDEACKLLFNKLREFLEEVRD